METWRSIDSIRVVRAFDDRPIEQSALDRLLYAGRRAGSSKNLQRWAFIVVRDRNRLRQLAAVGPFAGHVGGAALAIALITPDPHAEDQPLSVVFDLGRAAQNMVLAAWDMGIGSVPATVYEHEAAKVLLGLPPDHHCEYVLSFGYPVDPKVLDAPKQRGGRKATSEIVYEDRMEERS